MTPQRALGLIRLSDLRESDLTNGASLSLQDQERRIRQWCDQRGWTLAEVLVENDITPDGRPKPASAFKRRKITLPSGKVEHRTIRPKFRAALDRITSGDNDALVALDLDRACRDPRDLEDLIDAAEQNRVPVESVTGSLRLTTDADVTTARIMVAVANKESRDKKRRMEARREVQAREGLWGGGRRPFGFAPDGVTIDPDEAKIIAKCADTILRGGSLRGLARDLREQAIPTVTGAPWTAATLRDILLRPRNAGRMVYDGQVIGTAPWHPIVAPELYDRMRDILTDSTRDTRAGTAPRWLGSGIYRCGICDAPMQIALGGREPRYRCKASAHLARAQAPVDTLVVGTVLAWLRRDAPEVFAEPVPGVDVKALRRERETIEANLGAIGGDVALGLMTRSAGHDATRRGRERIAAIDAELATVHGPDPTIGELARARDPWVVWRSLPLERQRMVIGETVTVTIERSGRRGRVFDPDSVRIDPVR